MKVRPFTVTKTGGQVNISIFTTQKAKVFVGRSLLKCVMLHRCTYEATSLQDCSAVRKNNFPLDGPLVYMSMLMILM